MEKFSRRNPKPRKYRKTHVTIPQHASPHVKLVFAEMGRQNQSYDRVEEGSGVLRATVKAWRHKNKPSLESIEAVLGFLGFDFVPIPRADRLPPEVIAELQPIADRIGLTMPQTVQALIGVVAGLPSRFEPGKFDERGSIAA